MHKPMQAVGSAAVVALIGYSSVLLTQRAPAGAEQPPASQPAPSVNPSAGNPDITALEAKRQQQREESLRTFMASRGFEEKPVQDAIIAHVQERERIRREVLQAGRKLLPTLRAKGQAGLKDEQIQSHLAEYRKALADSRQQREKAEATLEAKIGYSKNVRLQALLLLLGALDEGPAVLPL